ncbi:hypothetical protein Q7P37_004842 [Cladosporium fusiforme]
MIPRNTWPEPYIPGLPPCPFRSLGDSPGKSRLDVVVYHSKRLNCVALRLSLQIAFKRDGGHIQIRNHEWPIDLWDDLSEYVVERLDPWKYVLKQLITRSTDRAYYHVRNRLVCDFGQEVAVAEEAVWHSQWEYTDSRKLESAETAVDDVEKMMENMSL